jgi:cystathionine beta-synthase
MNERQDSYLMEGIGYDFIPRVIDRTVVDDWIKIDDQMALPMTRRIIKEEGMLCGGSSGGVLSAALKYTKEKGIKGKNVVVIFADNIRNYLTKLVADEWMVEKRFYPFESLNTYKESKLKDVSTEKLLASTPTI